MKKYLFFMLVIALLPTKSFSNSTLFMKVKSAYEFNSTNEDYAAGISMYVSGIIEGYARAIGANFDDSKEKEEFVFCLMGTDPTVVKKRIFDKYADGEIGDEERMAVEVVNHIVKFCNNKLKNKKTKGKK